MSTFAARHVRGSCKVRLHSRAGVSYPEALLKLVQSSGVFFAVLLLATSVAAQTDQRRVYRLNTADEDWTFLKTTPKSDVWDPVKYIGLGRDDWSLTLSGEFRLRPEGFHVRETSGRASSTDNYLLQRYLFGADTRFGKRLRAFVEIQSGIIDGQLRSPRPTDQNSADLHQLFVELRQTVRKDEQLSLTVGRQEIEVGSSRLISASPGLNVKRSFDGVVFAYRTPSWAFAAAGAELVGLRAGAFDDRAIRGQRFWGAAATRVGSLWLRSQLGAYYLGIDNPLSTYVQGTGPEQRHTVGVKWSGAGARLDLNYDVVLQWGNFAGEPIRAWAFATETGYRIPLSWRPRLSVRADLATGDRDPKTPSLQSFNPLFPGNSYSGAVGLFGPTNLTDFTPAINVQPRRSLVLGFEAPSYWRTSSADGIYSTDLRVLVGPAGRTEKYVGTNPGIIVVWQPTPHIQLQGAITRFLAGTFLDRSFVANGFGFYSFTTRYRF